MANLHRYFYSAGNVVTVCLKRYCIWHKWYSTGMVKHWYDIDENAEVAPDLPDKEFVKSREAILRLLPRLFPDKSSRWSELVVMEHFIDETVEEIARIWTKKTK